VPARSDGQGPPGETCDLRRIFVLVLVVVVEIELNRNDANDRRDENDVAEDGCGGFPSTVASELSHSVSLAIR